MQTFSNIMLVTVITVLTAAFLFGFLYEYLDSKYGVFNDKVPFDATKRRAGKLLTAAILTIVLVDLSSFVAVFVACRHISSSVAGWIASSLFTYLCVFVSGVMTSALSRRHYNEVFDGYDC